MNVELVRRNLGAYFLAEHPDYHWVSFQQEYIVPALHKVATHEIKALAILLPFRHAKTDLATLAFMSWLYGKYPKRSNMLLSYSDKFAKRFGRKILNLCRSDVHAEAFPESIISPTARSGSYFQTTQGGSFFSAGFSGTITGQGVDGVLGIDDPIKNKEEANSQVIMDARMEDYRSAANTRLEGGSKLLCTTRWGKRDFLGRLLEEYGELHEGGEWLVLKFPAEAGEDDPLERAPGEFLWPERLGRDWYLGHKKNKSVWVTMCQQEPEDEGGKRFKREWLRYYDKAVRPGKFPAYMITDPAKGSEARHDRTAIGVFVATPDKQILLVDGCLARLDPDQRAAEHIRLIRKWHPRRWIYEEFGLVNDTWYLRKATKRVGINVYPVPVGRKGPRHMLSKDDRISGLAPDFREGTLWLPDPDKIPFASVDMDDGTKMGLIDYFVNNEYLEYSGENSIPFDDFLDMMSRLHDPELGITFPAAQATAVASELERNARLSARHGGWESVL